MQLKVMITFLLCTCGHGGKAVESEVGVEGPLGNPFMRAKVFNQIVFSLLSLQATPMEDTDR